MESLAHLRRAFGANDWSNRTCLAALVAASAPSERALGWMGHLVGTEELWLGRLLAAPEPAVVWPRLPLAACASRLADLAGHWHDHLAGLHAAGLDDTITYVNSLGQTWTNTVHDVLQHTLLHAAYHRGQIAAELRAAGDAPAYTDYIHGIREGFVSG